MKKKLFLLFGVIYLFLTFYVHAAAEVINEKLQSLKTKKVASKERDKTSQSSTASTSGMTVKKDVPISLQLPTAPKLPSAPLPPPVVSYEAPIYIPPAPVAPSLPQPSIPNTPPSPATPILVAATEHRIIVGSFNELLAALKEAKGGEAIALKEGDYSGRIQNIRPSSSVKIISADSDHKARFTTLDIRGSANLTWSDLRFEFIGVPAKYQVDVRVSDSNNLTFSIRYLKEQLLPTRLLQIKPLRRFSISIAAMGSL